MQTITSAKTSIATVNKVYKDLENGNGKVIVDWGCGSYNHNKDLAESKGWKWFGYDPYNRSMSENAETLKYLAFNKADLVICSNVLNVINDDEVMNSLIKELNDYGKMIKFTIYEGDGSGIPKVTSKGYQRNAKAKTYNINGTLKGNIWTVITE